MSSLAQTPLNDKNHGCKFLVKHLDQIYKQTNDLQQGDYDTEQYGFMTIDYDHKTQETSIGISCVGTYPKAFESIRVSLQLESSVPFNSFEDGLKHNSSWVQEGFSFSVSRKEKGVKQEIKFLQTGNTAENRAYKGYLDGVILTDHRILGLSPAAAYPICSGSLVFYIKEVTLTIPPQEPRTYKDYLNIDFIEEYPRPDTFFIKDWELSATMRTTTC